MSDDSAGRATHLRSRAIDLRLPLARHAPPLPWRMESPSSVDDLPLHDIMHAARAVGGRRGHWLVNDANPLRRSDIWELLSELATLRPARLGICAFGHGLTGAVAKRLRAAGVQRVHVPFHCARQDAHDWLVGLPGALKAAHRAILACGEANLTVTAEIVLTRPTMAHLAETVEVLARLGVRDVCIRRLTAADVDGPTFVPLSARLSLLAPHLEHAATVAIGRRVRLRLRDLPLCAAPRLAPLFAAAASEAWVLADGTVQSRPTGEIGCATCPGGAQCGGAPPDYVARFGWEEMADGQTSTLRVGEDVGEQQTAQSTAPIVFSWRGPHRVRCEACADAAEDGAKAPPFESTRVIRARLVQAAEYRPALLRLVGADLLAHPQATLLIYDAIRLFRRVAVAGEASALVDWTDLDFRRLKDLARIDVALYGPDAASHDAHCRMPGAFLAMQRGIAQVRRKTSIPVGAYAIVHDARAIPAFAAAWSRGALPGEPRFRLSAKGASLDEIIECAQALPPGPARAALAALVPRCGRDDELLTDTRGTDAPVDDLQPRRIHCGRSVAYHPCGSDPLGAFEVCQEHAESCASSGCPGTAVGWHSAARSKRWTVSI